MAKIDTREWKKFKLTDIFRMNNTKSIIQKDIMPDSGDIPYVTAQAGDNGVLTYVDCPLEWLDEGNCIMIGGKTLTFSYQEKAFCSNDSHNIALYLKDDTEATKVYYLFLIAALRSALYQKYSWGDSISMKTIKDDTFLLPVNVEGKPDWAYMDAYMSEMMRDCEDSLDKLAESDGAKRMVDTNTWKAFAIGQLFDVVKGARLTKARMTPGDIRFIGSSAMNNGCTAMVGNTDNMHPANTLTVCYNGSVGETFYQDQPFLASDDVNVLYPKFDMTKEIALFIATLIKSISARYNYVNKWKQEAMIADEIMLPCTDGGVPDWAYMDEYMRSVMDGVATDLSAMRSIG